MSRDTGGPMARCAIQARVARVAAAFRTRRGSWIPVVLCGLWLAQPVGAQTPAPTSGTVPTAVAADVATVDGILAALYDVISGPAGQARDWDRFRSLFVPEAQLIPTGFPAGSTKARVRYMSVEDYIAQSGPRLEEGGFFESELGRVTERFENIAHAFSTYESRRTADGETFQRGINSIQLVWDGERWWITNIMWRGVAADVQIPAQYLRKQQQ